MVRLLLTNILLINLPLLNYSQRVCYVSHFYFMELITYSIWLLHYQFLEKYLKRSVTYLNGKYFYKIIERINVKLFKDTYIFIWFWLIYESNILKSFTIILTSFPFLIFCFIYFDSTYFGPQVFLLINLVIVESEGCVIAVHYHNLSTFGSL